MSELFPQETVESKSPMRLWMEKHNIKTSLCLKDIEEPWSAWSGDLQEACDHDALAFGDCEADAIFEWARRNGVRLWNEEGVK